MFYEFPYIKYIDPVLKAIEGADEFVVSEKDGYTVINYNYIKEDTFPDVLDYNSIIHGRGSDYDMDAALRRECRGIIFDKEGVLVRRPFHKFFNYREREETQYASLKMSHTVMNKMDGSMVAPFIIEGNLLWGTKMGVTDVSEQVTPSLFHINFARYCITQLNCTPIFEWCSRKQRIVLDYPEDTLALTAIRHMSTGVYMTYDDIYDEAENFHIPVVTAYDSAENLGILERYIHNQEDTEGFVIDFDGGHKLKLKSHWYLNLHKAKEALNRDKNLAALIIENRLDDLIPHLTIEDKTRVAMFSSELRDSIKMRAETISLFVTMAKESNKTRKEFALSISSLDPLTKSVCFRQWDGVDAEHVMNEIVLNKYDQAKKAWFPKVKFND